MKSTTTRFLIFVIPASSKKSNTTSDNVIGVLTQPVTSNPPEDFNEVKWLRGSSANVLFPVLRHVKVKGRPVLYPHGEGMTEHNMVHYVGSDGRGVKLSGVNVNGISVWIT